MQVAKHIHDVSLLVGSDLIRLMPNGKDRFSYTCEGDERKQVKGALIDDRFVPRDKPANLSPGETFDVTEDDVIYALEHIVPMERERNTRLQIVNAVYIESPLQIDELFPVVKPQIMLDPAEFVDQWHERTYCLRTEDNRHPAEGYERELILRLTDGRLVHLHGARPAGYNDNGHLMLRFISFEFIQNG